MPYNTIIYEKSEGRCFEMLFDTHDQKEGMKAFVEKRKPNFLDK